MTTSLVNGKPSDRIGIDDRGLCYGDGLFETMAVVDGCVRFEDQHFARLEWSCDRLGIPYPDPHSLRDEMHALIAQRDRAVLKLILTRGAGARGYRASGDFRPTRVLSVHGWPEYPASYYREGVAVRICETRLGSNPALGGIKHLNRLEQVLARREWDDDAIAEGVMLDGEDNVICGTMSNLFVVRAGRLLTPTLSTCGVRGVMRQVVMRLAGERGIVTEECELALEQLSEADEIFLTNVLIGIWPVVRFDERRFHRGTMCRSLMDGLAALGVAECAVS